MSDKGIDYNFGNNEEIYIAVTKHNALFAKLLSDYDSNKICSNYFKNFQNIKILTKHKNYCKNSDYNDRVPQKKFETKIGKKTDEKREEPETYYSMHFYLCLYINKWHIVKKQEMLLKTLFFPKIWKKIYTTLQAFLIKK